MNDQCNKYHTIRIEKPSETLLDGLALLVEEQKHINSHLFQIERKLHSIPMVYYYKIRHSILIHTQLTTREYHIYTVPSANIMCYNEYMLYDDCNYMFKETLQQKWELAVVHQNQKPAKRNIMLNRYY